MLDILSDIAGRQNGHIHDTGGISISHTGTPGAVLARMFIAKPNKGYSAATSFIDPETTASQRWHGNGLRFRNLNGQKLDPVVTARNTGDQPSHINGKIIYTRPDGEVVTINLPQRTVEPRTTKAFDLSQAIANASVPNSVQYAGIELEYNTARGSVITSVQSISQNGQHVFQVPMFDPQNMPSSAGGFPWKADGDFTTVVYIKNETDVERRFAIHLRYPHGGGYSAGMRKIRPGQTLAFDFREMRDNQTPDSLGGLIPLNLEHGQISWGVHGAENKVLSGRSEQISVANGIASTYSCANCCPPNITDVEIEPPEPVII